MPKRTLLIEMDACYGITTHKCGTCPLLMRCGHCRRFGRADGSRRKECIEAEAAATALREKAEQVPELLAMLDADAFTPGTAHNILKQLEEIDPLREKAEKWDEVQAAQEQYRLEDLSFSEQVKRLRNENAGLLAMLDATGKRPGFAVSEGLAMGEEPEPEVCKCKKPSNYRLSCKDCGKPVRVKEEG